MECSVLADRSTPDKGTGGDDEREAEEIEVGAKVEGDGVHVEQDDWLSLSPDGGTRKSVCPACLSQACGGLSDPRATGRVGIDVHSWGGLRIWCPGPLMQAG